MDLRCFAPPSGLLGYPHVVCLIVLTSAARDWWSTLSRNHRSRSMTNTAKVEHCAALAAEDCGMLLSRSPYLGIGLLFSGTRAIALFVYGAVLCGNWLGGCGRPPCVSLVGVSGACVVCLSANGAECANSRLRASCRETVSVCGVRKLSGAVKKCWLRDNEIDLERGCACGDFPIVSL